MAHKYRTTPGLTRDPIERVEIAEETATLVRRAGFKTRDKKVGKSTCYFDTWQDARDWLLREQQAVADRASARHERASDLLAKYEALQPPDGGD